MGATAGGPRRDSRTLQRQGQDVFLRRLPAASRKGHRDVYRQCPKPGDVRRRFQFRRPGISHLRSATTTLVDGVWVRDPFPGNIIPQNRIDPVIKNILARNPWKAQNDPGTLDSERADNNLVVPTKGRYYITRWDGKVDHQFSSGKQDLRPLLAEPRPRAGPDFQRTALVAGGPRVRAAVDLHNLVFSDTHTFSPTADQRGALRMERPQSDQQSAHHKVATGRKQLGIPNVSPETFPGHSEQRRQPLLQPRARRVQRAPRRGHVISRTTSRRSSATTP